MIDFLEIARKEKQIKINEKCNEEVVCDRCFKTDVKEYFEKDDQQICLPCAERVEANFGPTGVTGPTGETGPQGVTGPIGSMMCQVMFQRPDGSTYQDEDDIDKVPEIESSRGHYAIKNKNGYFLQEWEFDKDPEKWTEYVLDYAKRKPKIYFSEQKGSYGSSTATKYLFYDDEKKEIYRDLAHKRIYREHVHRYNRKDKPIFNEKGNIFLAQEYFKEKRKIRLD